MNQAINTCITGLNNIGQGFWDYAAGIFIQVSVLIVLLLIIDFLLRKRVRAVFRYGLWMLLLVKLVLPASFTLPTGIGYWLGDYFPSEVSMAKWIPQTEEIVPTTLNIHQRSIPLEPVVTNETAVIDIYQGLIPLEPVMTNETAATGIELEPICWQGLVFLGWLVGMLVLLVLLVKRVCFVRGLIAQSRPANEQLLDILNEGRSQIGIRQNIELRLSGNTLSPAVCGLFKPIILIPAALLKKLSREKLKAVLIHELAHIKRGDGWVNLLQTMLQIVYFYNPLVWIANAMIRRVREQAVDEMVLVTLKPETKSYSNMLIDIAEMAFWRPKFSLRLIGVVESKKALERRIKHMLSRPVPKSSKLGYLGLIAIVLIGAILLPMGSNSMAEAANTQKQSRVHSETNTIVPGVRVGDYTFGMSKNEVLRKLGEPKAINYGGERYTLDNLPGRYYMIFDDISFEIVDDAIQGMTVYGPSYQFADGLGVGDPEEKIKQSFGKDYQLKETEWKDYLTYEDEGLTFEIHKKDRTVMEINVSQITNDHGDSDAPEQEEQSKHTIVPGVRVGDYTIGMSKDEVLRKLGEPKSIHYGGERYTLDNLPGRYYMIFDDISFEIDNDSVKGIGVHSPLYKFTNGLGVGDSEQKIKQAFGDDFHLEEDQVKDFLIYEDKGLQFEIYTMNRMVIEINVSQTTGDHGNSDAPEQEEQSKHTIVPGVRVGDYTIDMSKDDVLKRLGEPGNIHFGGERYTLNNLPRRYIMSFGDISFGVEDDTVTGISVRSSLYKFTNGLGVGNSEQEIKRAFGSDFQLEEYGWKSQLNYENRGIQFEIRNKDKMVIEIDVYRAERDQQSDRRSSKDLSNLVRQAAAKGRISFKLTTPDEFKAIAGQPTREWTDAEGEVIYMEYPGIEVKFFGKPEINIPHTVLYVLCERRKIDIGQNRPVVLRNEGDLDKFGTFWGYSSVDLSRLDLSQKGELLKAMPFDSRTVWPEPDRLPPDFDPKNVMEWGKYPGLRVKQLHDRGVTGKGVHVAIIDQPLLLGHIEYKDQLVSYKEIQTGNADPQMHGPPVASILVGKTCGVAPEAILHYWAEPSWKGDYKYRCIALEQIIQYNREKTKSEQIRVVSVSKGFSLSEPNLDRWKALLEKAKQSGIYVVHCSSMGFGAGCRFLEDSDNPASYRLCAFYKGGTVYRQSGTFFTPIDHRTTASEKARDAYTFWTRGGLSWGAPYYAGVVALGMQVNPDLRPNQIDKLLYDSGWDFQRGRLINPVGFVEAAQKAD